MSRPEREASRRDVCVCDGSKQRCVHVGACVGACLTCRSLLQFDHLSGATYSGVRGAARHMLHGVCVCVCVSVCVYFVSKLS